MDLYNIEFLHYEGLNSGLYLFIQNTCRNFEVGHGHGDLLNNYSVKIAQNFNFKLNN